MKTVALMLLLCLSASAQQSTYQSPNDAYERTRSQRLDNENRQAHNELLRLEAERLKAQQATKVTRSMIFLDVAKGSHEAAWRDALASKLQGKTEQKTKRGRIDVTTKEYAIEVDRLENFDEGYGQALRYAVESGKAPSVALIVDPLSLSLIHI